MGRPVGFRSLAVRGLSVCLSVCLAAEGFRQRAHNTFACRRNMFASHHQGRWIDATAQLSKRLLLVLSRIRCA